MPYAEVLYDGFMASLPPEGWNSAAWLERRFPEARSLEDCMAQLSRFKEWLEEFCPLPPAVAEELQGRFVVGLTYNSNAIEGNTLSRQETEMVLSHGVTVGGKSLVEHLEVIGHRDAMGYMEELAAESGPLDQRVIKDIHSLIMMPVNSATGFSDAGIYRNIDVQAAGSEHRYPPHYRVPELMDEFAAWLGSTAAAELHPLLRAAEVHYRFVSIHPFRDGNGRTGRLLKNLSLLRSGYPIAVIPVTRRAEYIDSLVYAQSHHDDIEALTRLLASACRKSFADYFDVIATAGGSRGRGAAFYRAVLEDCK